MQKKSFFGCLEVAYKLLLVVGRLTLYFRTTNLGNLVKIELLEEHLNEFNSLADQINELQCVKKKKVIFLARLGHTYKGAKAVNKIEVIEKIKNEKENINFSDEDQ